MAKEEYQISVTGNGVSIKRKVSKEVGDRVVVLILAGAEAGEEVERGENPEILSQPGRGRGKKQSIREFLNEVEVKRVPDTITAIGCFLKNSAGKDHFTSKDLIANFEAASERVPTNLSRDIKWTIRAGWITPKIGQKDTYYVTDTGKTATDKHFSKDVVAKTKGLAHQKKKAVGSSK